MQSWWITWKPKHLVILSLERKTVGISKTKGFNPVSETCRRDIVKRYPGVEGRIQVLRNGVDSDHYHPHHRKKDRESTRQDLGVTEKEILVLLVGTGFVRKGVDVAIESLALARKNHPFKLCVVGKGDAARYARIASKWGVESAVRFTGPVRDLIPFHAAADVFLLPTRYDPFPNACMEAMASGC